MHVMRMLQQDGTRLVCGLVSTGHTTHIGVFQEGGSVPGLGERISHAVPVTCASAPSHHVALGTQHGTTAT
jgi:hypothetical protein